MPDARGLRCYRVEIRCGEKTRNPIISARNEQEAREKAHHLASEMCRLRFPWQRGGEDQPPTTFTIGAARRLHRWWTE